jgi:16S rRNA (cytosine967-C5)-methyltransferase
VAVTEARRAALVVLSQVARGRRLDLALDEGVRRLPPQDRRWVHELVYGVTRLRGRLDFLLDVHVEGGLARLSQPVTDVLRSGAYQLLYMGSVPAYAAVSQAVEQARSQPGRGSGSLVNAVLRRVSEQGESPEIFPRLEADPAGFLSTWGSHPRWLIDRWLARWPTADVLKLVELDNRPPPLVVVPLELTPPEAVQVLAGSGVDAREAGRGSGAVEVTGGAVPSAVLDRISAVVQDAGAALVGVYADVPAGARAADLCAAPGGKTLALTRRASYVLAADRSLARLRLVQENLQRTKRRAGLVIARAEEPPIESIEFVLLDVPCTGTGTLRRHPDARWRLTREDVGKLARVQARMLDAAAGLVPIGGVLVYSTCTLEPEENEEQVEAFLARHERFEVAPTEALEPSLLERGRLQVLPQRTGFDGAFAARLRRTG